MARLTFREKEIIIKALAPTMNIIGGPVVDPDVRNLYLRMVKYANKEYTRRGNKYGEPNHKRD